VGPIAAAAEVRIDRAKSSGAAKLARVVTRDRIRFGTFEVNVRLAVTESTEKLKMTFDPPAAFTVAGTIELAIDGGSTEQRYNLKTGMAGSGLPGEAGTVARVSFDLTEAGTDHVSAEVPASDAKAPAVTWLPAPGEWLTFRPKDESLAVQFPQPPKVQQPDTGRRANTTLWAAPTKGGTVVYMVSITDFEGADPAKLDPAALLEVFVKSQKDPTDLKDIKVDGYPGIEFRRADKADGKDVEFRHRAVIANGRLYQQALAAEKGKAKPEDVDRFFNSFKILAKPKPKDD
jgi:hypothetical protein